MPCAVGPSFSDLDAVGWGSGGSSRNPTPRAPVVRHARANVQAVGSTAIDTQVQWVPLDESRPDAESIIAALQQYVEQFGRDPQVRAVSEDIIAKTGDRTNNNVNFYADTLTAWVRKNLIYMADADGAEYFQSPLVMLERILLQGVAYGDCDDHVMLLGSMLVSVGIPVRVQGVKIPPSTIVNHVILSANISGKWQDIDVIAKGVQSPPYFERLEA